MVIFCWKQLPVYAARAIGRFVRDSGEKTMVLRIPDSRFAIKGAEAMTHCPVMDVQEDDRRSILELVGERPSAIVVGGWFVPSFVRWARETKRSGGRTIVCSDEAYIDRGVKQFLRKLRFKFVLSRWIDRMFVVGAGGLKQFVEYYGFPSHKMLTGLYGSDPELFHNGKPLPERPKRFLFVGHFDANKNVLPMCEAFLRVHESHPDWELELCGSGELEKDIPRKPGIRLTGFVQSENLGEKYRNARCLVLGSFAERWGVVVHEACASGCVIAVSDRVGSRYDFARPENSVIFDPGNIDAIAKAFERIVNMTDAELVCAQKISVELANGFSPKLFSENLRRAIKDS